MSALRSPVEFDEPALRSRRFAPVRPSAADLTLLKVVMAGFLASYGYTALHRCSADLLAQIAKENRERLASEGWIA